MTKIDKTDIENIKLISKEAKIQKINKVKIKKGNYEIEISSINNLPDLNQKHSQENKNDAISSKSDKEIVNDENIVKSPMVGVAYLSADPNTKPYVKIGQHVKQGDILILIEAMKTFNEVKAPKSGIIKEIVVLNSQPVEYGDEIIIFE